MSESHHPEEIVIANESALEELAWTIEAYQGRFLLVFARCNYTSLRSRLIQRLEELCPVDIRTLTLNPNDTALYARIQAELAGEQPGALMVLGLESVLSLAELLSSADLVREEFRKNCRFPLIVWVSDGIKNQWMQLAPNLESWGTSTEFNISAEELAAFIEDQATNFFTPNVAIDWKESLELESELEAAQADLCQGERTIEPELAANLESLLGFVKHNNNKPDAALEYYQRAGEHWGQLGNWERQGYILFRTVDCYYHQALAHPLEHPIWATTRDHLHQTLQAFEQANRPDLLADSIANFSRIFRKLQDWENLERLAQNALSVHQAQNRAVEVARDYGFLAEVALAQQRWTEAHQLAQNALELYPEEGNGSEREGELCRLRFSLARSQSHLGQQQAAIENLEQAKLGYPLDDFQLHLDILRDLHQLYFQNQEYLKAFKIKQERQAVETRLGLRAFIGASRIQSIVRTPSVASSFTSSPNHQLEPIAPEIIASGREKDVQELVQRVKRNDYKVVVLYGYSGVGKSSLVNAGLVPTLQTATVSGQTIAPVLIRVYTDWMRELAERLAEALASYPSRSEINSQSPLDWTQTSADKPLASHAQTAILEALQQAEAQNLRVVLIFDQFEEFFFVNDDKGSQPEVFENEFFEFLGQCLGILSLKIIFSLRQDYLHYLVDRPGMEAVNHDLLGKNVLYKIADFTPKEAQSLLEQLTQRSNFQLEGALIEQLVEDLAQESGKVRPIELQVVGAQLQVEKIRTLAEYRRFGTKEELVLRYLAEVVGDCGEENRQVAELLLYLLTNEKDRRLLKTREELAGELADFRTVNESQLDLVLEILVASGLVFLVPDTPNDRYQLVHDYLVPFIRQQQEPKIQEIIAQLNQEREQRQQLERSIQQVRGELTIAQAERERVNREVERAEQTKQQLEQENRKVSQRVRVGSVVLVLTLVTAGVALAWTGAKANRDVAEAQRQEEKARQGESKARQGESEAQRRVSEAQQRESEATKRVSAARQRAEAAQKQVKDSKQQLKEFQQKEVEARQRVKEAQQRVAAAQQRETAAQQSAAQAQQQIVKANQQVEIAERREQEANEKVKLAQVKAREAEGQFQLAQVSLAQAEAEQAQAQKETEEAQKGTELERRGTLALRQFNYTQIPALLTAMKAGKELKGIVKDRPIEEYPASSPLSALQQILDQIRERNQLRGHESSVNTVKFSPDGKTLASASGDNTVRLWDIQGKELAVLRSHEGSVWNVQFSPDGKTLASASRDKTVRLWDIQGQELAVLRGHEREVRTVEFS
ncbi:MAG TPA: hypothetical protein DC064_13005, partial [Cyanobacteria bacterium UBA9273]|nr:hypothetical protein [Cyanobacteria bacterium UBA9273]